jgi:glycosyltransferase involved in cell wall biosynthesis
MAIRLLYLVSHPIQYQAPLLRRVARESDIDLRVVFETDAGETSYFDPGFQVPVKWDVPLRDGYRSEVLPDDALDSAIAHVDAVWLHGWHGPRMRRAMTEAARRNTPVLMRGENTLAAMPDGAGLRGLVKRRYLDWIFARCAAFLYIGTANRDYYRAHGVDPSRLFFMPYAVDNDFFRARAVEAATGREAFRASLNLASDRPVILFAGKLQRRKHPLTLIAAFQELDYDRLGRPYLVFVGDGELRDSIIAAAAHDDRIRFLGFRNQTEMPAFYDLADVFVLPAEKEPWGLAVNEAMNAGCPVIVTDQCGCHADLVNESCGAVVPSGNADALAAALTRVIGDPERRRVMGNAARERISTWNFETCVAGLKTALAYTLQKPPPT